MHVDSGDHATIRFNALDSGLVSVDILKKDRPNQVFVEFSDLTENEVWILLRWAHQYNFLAENIPNVRILRSSVTPQGVKTLQDDRFVVDKDCLARFVSGKNIKGISTVAAYYIEFPSFYKAILAVYESITK